MPALAKGPRRPTTVAAPAVPPEFETYRQSFIPLRDELQAAIDELARQALPTIIISADATGSHLWFADPYRLAVNAFRDKVTSTNEYEQ